MAYTITCYAGDDPTIEYIKITLKSNSTQYTETYRCYYEDGTCEITPGYDDMFPTFEAFPIDGCSFVRWTYTKGSPTATEYRSTLNPFTTAGGQDIYISATGQEEILLDPYIEELTITQTQEGEKTAKVSWAGSDLAGGYYYILIYDEQSSKYTLNQEGSVISNSMTVTMSFADFGTYSVRVRIENGGSSVYRTRTVTIADSEEIGERPDDWEWEYNTDNDGFLTIDYNGVDNNVYPVKASVWNAFTQRINDFRRYRKREEYQFTRVYPEDDMTCDLLNEAVEAIQGMGAGIGYYLPDITSELELTVELFEIFASELNAIE